MSLAASAFLCCSFSSGVSLFLFFPIGLHPVKSTVISTGLYILLFINKLSALLKQLDGLAVHPHRSFVSKVDWWMEVGEGCEIFLLQQLCSTFSSSSNPKQLCGSKESQQNYSLTDSYLSGMRAEVRCHFWPENIRKKVLFYCFFFFLIFCN